MDVHVNSFPSQLIKSLTFYASMAIFEPFGTVQECSSYPYETSIIS